MTISLATTASITTVENQATYQNALVTLLQNLVSGDVNLLTANGAIPFVTNSEFVATQAGGTNTAVSGTYVASKQKITKAGVCALTLQAPDANSVMEGHEVTIYSDTAYAHTVTATGLYKTGTASVNLATYAAYAGASMTLIASGGGWVVKSSTGITFS